jgi:chromosome segregation ATPase
MQQETTPDIRVDAKKLAIRALDNEIRYLEESFAAAERKMREAEQRRLRAIRQHDEALLERTRLTRRIGQLDQERKRFDSWKI